MEGVIGSIANDQRRVPVSHIELKGRSVWEVDGGGQNYKLTKLHVMIVILQNDTNQSINYA